MLVATLLASLALSHATPEPACSEPACSEPAHPQPVPPASHLWVVNELYSDPSGTIQFVELWECCGSTIETQMQGKSVTSDATGKAFTFPVDLTGNTAHRFLLLGTAGYAALPGAPAPDFIVPDGFVALDADTVRWYAYPNAPMAFTSGQLPTDGVNSLHRGSGAGVNSPTNYAGVSGSISLGSVPALSLPWLGVLGVALGLVGAWALRRVGPARA
jgi:hypothetical protein